MANYKTPGVYIEEISKFPPSVAQVETAIPAFIGYTEKAELPDGTSLIEVPLRITSELEYFTFFGGPPIQNNIVIELDDEEVGEGEEPTPLKAHIGEINEDVIDSTSPSPFRMAHAISMFYANGGGPCYIVSVGDYEAEVNAVALGTGNPEESVLGGLTAARKIEEITLLLFPDADGIEDHSSYYDLFEAALTQCREMQDRFTIIDVRQEFTSNLDEGIATPIDAMRNELTSDFLHYGAAYWPYLNTTLTYRRNLNEVRFFRPGNDSFHNETIGNANVSNKMLSEINGVLDRMSVLMPPSSAIAGVYARIDGTRGVWKAPANTGITRVKQPAILISSEEQESMNVHPTGKSVNAIRSFVGRGILVWGARTLAGNDNEWRYVPVRRFFIMAEISIKKATEQFVFEPNDANTWTKVRAMIENFLLLQWRAGALAGTVPEDAYFVRVGLGSTMTAMDILEGRMIVEIGMAVVRPAEFIILKFSHKMQES